MSQETSHPSPLLLWRDGRLEELLTRSPLDRSPGHPLLLADGVSYAYRQASPGGRLAVDDVTVRIDRGSITGLLGPNGCGKTTLLKILSGIVPPHAGRVTLDGRPLATMSRREAAREIAVVPQETHPAFDFTCLEMALMGRHPHLGALQLEGPRDIEIARRALDDCGTAHLAARPYMTLSGGEKQRVIIASALTQASNVLLLDEPTASLDLGYQLEISSLLARLNREQQMTMVLATHDLNLAAGLCDRLVLLREGRVLADGPTAEVLTPERVRALYDVDADVTFHDRAGHLTVVPVSRSAR